KPTEYKRPETFEAFLELNSIMEKELTVEEFDSVIEANEVINVNLKKAIETAEIERKKINFVKFRYLNLFGQNTENVYTYSPNF
ncbi:MAG: hypothetical protein ABIP51_20805, partial [Bacteroidia bacterium]